jgi:phosphoheptose isomerase
LFARQIKALGRSGDVLVCIGSQQAHTALLRAIQTAHEIDMGVVILCNQELSDLCSLISGEDVSVAIHGARASTVFELQIMCIHRLIELIEQSLFFNNMEEPL